MRASIVPATEQDLNDIQRFWYDIYVSEMQRHISDPLTDHDARILRDPLTPAGKIYIARDERRAVVATVMNTTAASADLGKYENLYGIDRLEPQDRARASITTKLMVAPLFRRTRLPLLMATKIYQHLLEIGMEVDHIDCNDHLVGFFLKLGFLPHRGRIVHRDYGAVNSMALQLRDSEHLKSVNSPFLRALNAYNAEHNNQSGEASHAA